MNQSKKLTDGALLTAIFIVLTLITFFIPFTSIFLTFVLPVPFIIFAARYDWKPSFIMLVATIILSSLFTTIFSIPLAVLSGLGGIMIGVAIKRGLSAYETLARGTVGFIVGLLFALLVTQVLFDVNIMDEMNLVIEESLEMSRTIMDQFGLPEEQLDEQFALMEELFMLFTNLLPMLIVMMALIQALLSQWVSYKVMNRVENKQLRFPRFHNLQFPVSIIWIYFLALIIVLFQPDPEGLLFIGLQNILMLAGFFMVIQGFSLIFFYAHHKKMSKAMPIIAIVVTLFFSQLLLPLVRILGIIDIGFRLRERMTKKQ